MARKFKSMLTRFIQSPIRKLGLLALAFAVAFGLAGYRNIEDFLANASIELASIALTVLIIDFLNEYRMEQQLKAQFIRELGSKDNGIALRAVNELRAHGWINDGSLRRARLWRANLQEANLDAANLEGAYLNEAILEKAYLFTANLQRASLSNAILQKAVLGGAQLQEANLGGANLNEADLGGANLEGTDLESANLKGANCRNANLGKAMGITEVQLAQAAMLQGATMSDGTRYNGRFNLPGEINLAHDMRVDTNDPEAMSRFYGISLKEYTEGQEWAQLNLPRLRDVIQ